MLPPGSVALKRAWLCPESDGQKAAAAALYRYVA